MKKIFSLICILACSVALHAQKYLEVYRDGDVIGSMMATDVDSVRVTGDDASSRQIHFFAAGMHKAFKVSAIDSIKVNRTGDDPFVYLGVVGFNNNLYEMPIDILATSTSNRYSDFVYDLMRKDGTLLYYGVEHALELLEQYDFMTPLTSVNLITFTDGLDQGSLMMSSDYMTDMEYLSALNRRINSTIVRGIPVTAYSLGLRGSDVSDYAQFQNNLRLLASDESKAREVSSMSDVQKRLQEIAEQIISISHRQNISAKIPGTSNGTRVRFTFDGNSPEYSTMYIEGILNLAERSLRDVTYHGIRSTSGTLVKGVQDGIFITFTFSNLYRIDGNGLIPTNYILQYNQAPGSTTWQRNSEFTPDNNTQTNVAHSGAAIMLVLDCSNSLGSQFGNMQNYANNFISRVAQNAVAFNLLAPENPLAELAFDGSDFIINLSWDAVKYAESYTIYRNNSKIAEGVTATSWTDRDLSSDSNFYIIEAVGHGITSPQSVRTETIHKLKSLDVPTNVTAALSPDEKSILVSWDAVKHAESYTVYRSTNSSDGFEVVAKDVTSTNWSDTPSNYGFYYYKVYAVGHGLISIASEVSAKVSFNHCEYQELQNGILFNINGVSFTMIKVKGGIFQMGIPTGNRDERPVHQVTLTNDFYLGETEVTQELWGAIMHSNPSWFKSTKQLPVEEISWKDCQIFITKLNELTGRTFRLPSEAEWEYAARGGNASKGYTYSGSNQVDDVAWCLDNSGSTTHEVATKAPNELGIYDMSGNVWEWCQDWYSTNYYSSSLNINPTGPTTGTYRVVRGGGINSNNEDCRVADRRRNDPSHSFSNLGLRIAL